MQKTVYRIKSWGTKVQMPSEITYKWYATEAYSIVYKFAELLVVKEVSKLMRQLYKIDTAYNIENSKKVTEKLKTIEVNKNTTLMSLDVKDMFTNILVT